jgi:hypothetical protein
MPKIYGAPGTSFDVARLHQSPEKTPILQSPKRKLREIAWVIPETHSLGSRLGLSAVWFR